MSIPAYIIDEIQKDRARRKASVLDELQIELEIPREIATTEQPEDTPRRGIADVDFFI